METRRDESRNGNLQFEPVEPSDREGRQHRDRRRLPTRVCLPSVRHLRAVPGELDEPVDPGQEQDDPEDRPLDSQKEFQTCSPVEAVGTLHPRT